MILALLVHLVPELIPCLTHNLPQKFQALKMSEAEEVKDASVGSIEHNRLDRHGTIFIYV